MDSRFFATISRAAAKSGSTAADTVSVSTGSRVNHLNLLRIIREYRPTFASRFSKLFCIESLHHALLAANPISKTSLNSGYLLRHAYIVHSATSRYAATCSTFLPFFKIGTTHSQNSGRYFGVL